MAAGSWLLVLGASFLAGGVATGLGALPVLALGQRARRYRGLMLGFGAGVMLAATAFSLLVPALEQAGRGGHGKAGASLVVSAGLAAGAAVLWLLNKYAPHEHFLKGPEGSDPARVARAWLFVIAITLHNFPEGLAVGVGLGSGEARAGAPLVAGIALQNVPEGLVVALSLAQEKYSRGRAVWIAFLTGLAEPLGAMLGLLALRASAAALPFGLAFAGGAMLFVVSDEVIPESHHPDHGPDQGTLGVVGGFLIMMVLDTALG